VLPDGHALSALVTTHGLSRSLPPLITHLVSWLEADRIAAHSQGTALPDLPWPRTPADRPIGRARPDTDALVMLIDRMIVFTFSGAG
jgi:hypothetical protein